MGKLQFSCWTHIWLCLYIEFFQQSVFSSSSPVPTVPSAVRCSLPCSFHTTEMVLLKLPVTSQWGAFQAFPWLLCYIRRYWTLLKFPIPCLPKHCRSHVLFLMIHFLSLMVLSLPSLPFLTFPTGTTKILFLFHFCILTLTDQSHLDSFLYADDF